MEEKRMKRNELRKEIGETTKQKEPKGKQGDTRRDKSEIEEQIKGRDRGRTDTEERGEKNR